MFSFVKICCLKVTVAFCNSELILGKNAKYNIFVYVSLLLLVALNFFLQFNWTRSSQDRFEIILFFSF